MSRLTSYGNEFISFLVMFLLLAALVSGQLYARAENVASAAEGSAEIGHVRVRGE